MARPLHGALAAVALSVALAAGAQPAAAAGAAPQKLNIEALTDQKASGDFSQMLERRRIRVLAPYSRTLYFNDKAPSAASPPT
ncbi:MAG: hypothetical protein U5L03_16015 [Burkholderiaceae bacterium]|nr:hypothetical protein [Burkholderiaceae bacterium]